MRAIEVESAGAFLDRVAPLVRTVAMHSTLLGIVNRLIDQPDAFRSRFLVVEDETGSLVGAVVARDDIHMTDAMTTQAARTLAELVHRSVADVRGVNGNGPALTAFVDQWRHITGVEPKRTLALGAFELRAVEPVRIVPGAPRMAESGDRETLVEWTLAFTREALPYEAVDVPGITTMIEGRLSGRSPAGLMVWVVDGDPVAMTGHSGPMPGGIRVSLVYTPPKLRGRGYATCLVAYQAQHLLDAGHEAIFLWTDLANPTSNRIYERIGYRKMGEAARFRLT